MDKDFLQALFWRLGTEDGDIPEDAISEVPPTPPNSHLIEHFDECVRYKGIESYAKYFVESLLKEANRYCEIKIVSGLEEARRPRWPSIEEFTVDLGSTTIHVYLNTFELIEDWLFCVNYIFAQSDEVSDFYYYEVKSKGDTSSSNNVSNFRQNGVFQRTRIQSLKQLAVCTLLLRFRGCNQTIALLM